MRGKARLEAPVSVLNCEAGALAWGEGEGVVWLLEQAITDQAGRATWRRNTSVLLHIRPSASAKYHKVNEQEATNQLIGMPHDLLCKEMCCMS